MLGHAAPAEEIREAITPELTGEIELALAGARRESQTVLALADEQIEQFMVELGGFVKLTGGGWPPEHRQEFIDQAASDLSDIPVALLAPAIRQARKRVWDPKRFVSWIYEFVEADMRKLESERERLERLLAIAKG